jgi:hypothetical protein
VKYFNTVRAPLWLSAPWANIISTIDREPRIHHHWRHHVRPIVPSTSQRLTLIPQRSMVARHCQSIRSLHAPLVVRQVPRHTRQGDHQQRGALRRRVPVLYVRFHPIIPRPLIAIDGRRLLPASARIWAGAHAQRPCGWGYGQPVRHPFPPNTIIPLMCFGCAQTSEQPNRL